MLLAPRDIVLKLSSTLRFARNAKRRFSFSRLTHNYLLQSQQQFGEDIDERNTLRHPFFSWLDSAYSSEMRRLDHNRTLAEAEKIISQPFLDITEKSLVPPSGNKSDYLSFKPYCWLEENINPLQKVSIAPEWRDGRPNPYLANLSDKPKLAQLCSRIHLLALAWRATRDNRFKVYAEQQLIVWFINPVSRMSPHMEYAQLMPWSGEDSGLGIIDARWLILMIEGLVLFGGKETFNNTIINAIMNWLQSFATWIMGSLSGRMEVSMKNNRGSWVDALLVYIALSLGKESSAQAITQHALGNRPEEQLDRNFKQHLELRRFTFIGYSLYNIFPLYHLLTYASWCFANGKGDFIDEKSRRKVQLLIKSAQRLRHIIPRQEKGLIESIPFKTSNDLNLFYPYSLEQTQTFPAILPFTQDRIHIKEYELDKTIWKP